LVIDARAGREARAGVPFRTVASGCAIPKQIFLIELVGAVTNATTMRKLLASLGLALISACGTTSVDPESSWRVPLPREPAGATEPSEESWTLVSTSSLPWLFENGTDVAEASEGAVFVAGAPYRGDGTANRNFGLLKVGDDGRPDPSFGNGGLAVSFVDADDGVARDVLATAGGEIICGYLLSEGASYFAVARLDLLGRPSGSQEGGNAEGEFLMREPSACRALAGAPGDSYVAGGEIMAGHVFVRFQSDGTPDATFGEGGRVVVPNLVDGSCCVRDISVASDGSIYVSTSPGGYVFRITPEGTHDLTFGANGYLVLAGAGESLQLHGNGFVVAGYHRTGYKPFVERYFLDGTRDETFLDAGTLVLDRFGELTDTDIDGDGLIAVGRTDVGGLILRIDASGQIDPEFGIKDFPLDNATEFNAVEVFSDGNIVISGYDPLLFRIVREPPSSTPAE
jgi:uncharacterized delta-60 repeat protein